MLFNYIFDNDLVFYNLFSTTAGYIGYSLITSYLDYFYVDKIFKLILEMNISDRPSQILQTSHVSINTQTPTFSPVEQINVGTIKGK
jgi:hypothetical protein